MKPAKIRHLLSQHAKLNRLYLVPEEEAIRKKRQKAGGNKKVKFTEGWVEFLDKKEAKRVAEGLNNTIIGGKKGGFFHDDTWCVKYLKKFKWNHLTEKIAHENRIREQKLKLEISQARRENDLFMESREQAKTITKIKERKASKAGGDAKGGGGGGATNQVRRTFKQKAPILDSADSGLLQKVFTERDGKTKRGADGDGGGEKQKKQKK